MTHPLWHNSAGSFLDAHDAAKQAKIADMKVPARPRASPGDLRPLSALLGLRSG